MNYFSSNFKLGNGETYHISRDKVLQTIKVLKARNSEYSDVTICSQNIELLPLDQEMDTEDTKVNAKILSKIFSKCNINKSGWIITFYRCA